MKSNKRLFWGIGLVIVLSAAAYAHVGVTVFYPQVPDPAAITIDGRDDDWGWYDPSLALNQEDFWDRASDFVEKSDYDFTILNAWSAPPDNRWYAFARFQDDTLKLDTGVLQWWKDDMLQIAVDADHAGGPILGTTLEEIANGQRFHIRIKPQVDPLIPGQSACFYSQLEFLDDPGLLWGMTPEFFEIQWTLLPTDADHGSVNVTYTYEWRAALWDIWAPTQGESVRHTLGPDDVIHLGYRPLDGDTPGGGGRKHSMYINGGLQSQDVNADDMPDFWALETAGGATSVEHSSWGRIKTYMNGQLH